MVTAVGAAAVMAGAGQPANAQTVANDTVVTAPISAAMQISSGGLASVENTLAGFSVGGNQCTAYTQASWSVEEDAATIGVDVGGVLYPGLAHLSLNANECVPYLDAVAGSLTVSLQGTDAVGLPVSCSAQIPSPQYVREGYYPVVAGGQFGTCTLGGESFSNLFQFEGVVVPTQGNGLTTNITQAELVGYVRWRSFCDPADPTFGNC